jgi:hypothetical protein
MMQWGDDVNPADLVADDPAIKASTGLSYEIGLMPRGVVLKQ